MFRVIFNIVNVIVFIFLILGLLASHISPQTFWPLAFLGLGLPYIMLVNLLWFIFHLLRWKKNAILPGIGLVLCLFSSSLHLKIFEKGDFKPDNKEPNSLRIMSFNVRLFDVYNWSSNRQTKTEILELFKQYNPDVLCLQEVYYERKGNFISLETIKNTAGYKYLHVENTSVHANNFCFGIITLSKFPIVQKERISFNDMETDNAAIATTLKINEDTIQIFNLHLESIRFRSEDYKTLENVTGISDQTNLDGEKQIVRRMKKAFKRRAKQADFIHEKITASKFTNFVCGDFNDTPGSYAYRKVRGKLQDAFSTHGKNTGSTYISRIPFLRIDYILYDENTFQCTGMERIIKPLSDHYPIVADFQRR